MPSISPIHLSLAGENRFGFTLCCATVGTKQFNANVRVMDTPGKSGIDKERLLVSIQTAVAAMMESPSLSLELQERSLVSFCLKQGRRCMILQKLRLEGKRVDRIVCLAPDELSGKLDDLFGVAAAGARLFLKRVYS